MNIIVLTNPRYINWVSSVCEKHMDGHNILIADNKKEGERFYNTHSYDIGISFMYQYKISKEQLDKPWFNFHPAPLPNYRGRNLCYHAIMNEEKNFGASLHYMDENFDTGEIIQIQGFMIESWMTAGDVSDKSIDLSKELFSEYYPRIIKGENFPEICSNTGGNYYYKTQIEEFIRIPMYMEKQIRAITAGGFYPKMNIGGIHYKIVRDE